jgi:hypothetical protein
MNIYSKIFLNVAYFLDILQFIFVRLKLYLFFYNMIRINNNFLFYFIEQMKTFFNILHNLLTNKN